MADLIRDTLFGHFIRLVSKQRYMQYEEERDPSLWKQYLDRDQTHNYAQFGHTDLSEQEQKEKDERLANTKPLPTSGAESKSPSSDSDQTTLTDVPTRTTTHEHQLHSALTNQRVDTEKGRDLSLVSWFGDNDPEVRIHPQSLGGLIMESTLIKLAEPNELVGP